MRNVGIVLFILLPVISHAQEEVSVTEVMVWVKAFDRSGKPVAGLSQTDFEVFEDGKRMVATCFEETEYSAPAGESEPPAEEPVPLRSKRVAVILDLYNTQQFEYLHIKPRIAQLISQIPASWEVMLATIVPGAVEVNVPFGSDVNAFQAKLDQITANAKRDVEVLNRRRSILQWLDRPSPRAVAEAYRLAQEYAMEEKEMARQSIRALEQFEKDLVRWKNDSHMVALYISGGISSEPGRQYFDLIDRRAAGGSGRGSLLSQREMNTDLRSMLRRIVAQLNRHNITFYTINTRGPKGPIPDDTIEGRRESRFEDRAYLNELQEFMAEIADQTGGLFFENSSNFKRGFDLVLSDLDHQYLICYKAPPHQEPNETHKIKVTTPKPGVKLRHREVYLD